MSRKSLSFFFLSFLGLALIGCNRGCTTSHTIESESTTISTNGGKVQIMGRVVDYRHSRRRGDNIFDRSVSHTYGLSFDIKFGTYISKDFYHEGVKDPKAVDLDKELKRVKVAVSKDKNHIGLGVDGKVVALIHLYKSNRIATNDPDLVADGTMSWSKLNIESYPSPGTILTEGLESSCDQMTYGNDAIIDYCNASKPSSKVHRIMIEKWPNCRVANDYFTEQKVNELSRNKKWRKKAVERAKIVLDEIDKHSFDFDEVMRFISALNAKELNQQLDELIIEKWGRKGMADYTSVLISRLEEKRNPMDYSNKMRVYGQAKAEFESFLESGKSNYRMEANKCLQVLNALGDTTAGYEFVENSFGTDVNHYNIFDFLDVAYGDIGVFTVYQQQQIMRKTEATFDSVKGSSRSSYFLAIDQFVDCVMLKRLKQKYPDDLKMYSVPRRCGTK